jgi:hypothetical protein
MKRHAPIATLASVAALLAATSLGAAAATDSELALFGKDPGKDKAFACYIRRYDAAHLKSHPKQNVGDMMLFVNSFVDSDTGRQYTLGIGVHFRKKATLFQLSGGCSTATDGTNALNCGIDCDGGRIDVRVKDADSILVSIPDGAQTWEAGEAVPPANARFGLDDKLFRLDRSKLQDCLPVVFDDDIKTEISKQK